MGNKKYDANLCKEIYRASLVEFTRRSFNVLEPSTLYTHNWSTDVICEALTACYKRQTKRLIINIPPRSLKSTCVTVAFPAWLLGKDPTLKIMAASYAQALSFKHSQDTRHLMQSEFYHHVFPETRLAKDQNAVHKFMTDDRGQRVAVSVGSAVTGDGGNFLILDDPLNPDQAMSDKERNSANDWHRQTWVSRLNNSVDDVMILVMQRLHEEDVTGMLLAQGGWEHICLPAVNDTRRTFSIGRGRTKTWELGELLDPVRLSQEVLDQKKVGMNTYAFAGQFLQRPVPEGGGIIKHHHWQYWEGKEPPKTTDIIQVYDTAYTEKTQNDYCARTTWGIFTSDDGEDNIILLEMMNERLEFPDLRSRAKESYKRFTKKNGDVPLVLIEEKSAGMPLIQEMRLAGMRVKGIKRNAHSGDKVSRAHNVTHIFESGRVWVPCNGVEVDGKMVYSPRPFAQEVIDNCAAFPFGTHDDLVDTVVDAIAFLRRRHEIYAEDDKEDSIDYSPPSLKKKRFYR